jgi:hypothetical protein
MGCFPSVTRPVIFVWANNAVVIKQSNSVLIVFMLYFFANILDQPIFWFDFSVKLLFL